MILACNTYTHISFDYILDLQYIYNFKLCEPSDIDGNILLQEIVFYINYNREDLVEHHVESMEETAASGQESGQVQVYYIRAYSLARM